MTRILQVGDSFLGVDPYRSELRAQEVWQGFERSVDAAIEHGADVWLHTGMLISEFCELREVEQRLRACLERLACAGVVPVLHQTRHDLLPLDVDCVLAGEPAVQARGLSFGSEMATAGGRRGVLVRHGRVEGCGGMDPALPTIDPWMLARTDTAWIALGGSASMRPIQPNAWYAGQTARIDARDTHAVGGLLVDLDPDGNAPARLRHLTWPDRPHHFLRFEARGLTGEELGRVLAQRVDAVIGPDPGPLGKRWPAVLAIRVQNAVVDYEQASQSEPRLGRLLESCCFVDLEWNGTRRSISG